MFLQHKNLKKHCLLVFYKNEIKTCDRISKFIKFNSYMEHGFKESKLSNCVYLLSFATLAKRNIIKKQILANSPPCLRMLFFELPKESINYWGEIPGGSQNNKT